ncbi:gamma carbonic anhydrase family protein [Haematospirillum sp. H1815]|uniref:gamma carbonic anhydrase family protein n=1 Tax=Haematospirillum sp. H1815 TaxID=2723108 RepID=UPI00143CAFD6|nr:gamma carbonic anhydrase family protein [Haematospirillum sp. H1815]NKD77171.1 gamma carbonic anhydrase family protein [Haematospirillum sp. H1815]
MQTNPIILPWRGVAPVLDPTVFVAPGASVIGDVVIGAGSSVWFGAVVRGDVHQIRIGCRSNIQDGTVVHVSRGKSGTAIGDDVLVGHNCIIHACTLQSRSFIGMGAVVMDFAVVESGAMVAAGALVPQGRRIPSGELWGGSPARKMRDLTPDETDFIVSQCAHYSALGKEYREMIVSL